MSGCAEMFKVAHIKQRLPDNTSNFTELKAVDKTLDAVTESEGRECILFSDLLSLILSFNNKKQALSCGCFS